MARLKTAISRIRAAVPHSLLVDGGDWSEGNIYYNEGAGRETLKMMDHLGYDVAVVGNHDWLNGAATLMSILEAANPAMKVIASNITTSDYDRQEEFRRRIPPYVIQTVDSPQGPIKIAFIGLLTYEFVYDKYFNPIKITEPFAVTRELAKRLKKEADAVIVISHNSIKLNQGVLLAAPDVDLLIGAHDHVKLTRPVVVNRLGARPAWIVETGCWGRYLGRVDLKITPRDPADAKSKSSVELLNYSLEQMDSSVPEDPETLKRITTLEALIEGRRGPIFHDHLGDSEVELARVGQENLMGDFATDAYLAATNADFAIDQTNFIYNEIHEGRVSTADVFNSNPGIYSPQTDKAWTISLLPVQGKTLSWILNLLYSNKSLSQQGAINFSGADVVYSLPLGLTNQALLNPGFSGIDLRGLLDPTGFSSTSLASIKSFKIRGEELQSDRTYIIAVSGGVVQALGFIHGLLPSAVPLEQMRDTGQEDWRVMADYLAAHSPLQSESIAYGRVHTAQPDLGLLYDDIRWEPKDRDSWGRMLARIHVRVRNTGMLTSPAGTAAAGPRVALLLNDHGVNYAIDPLYHDAAPAQALPELAPGESTELSWDSVAIPQTLGVYAITARIIGNDSESNHSNDEVTRYFVAARPATLRLAHDR